MAPRGIFGECYRRKGRTPQCQRPSRAVSDCMFNAQPQNAGRNFEAGAFGWASNDPAVFISLRQKGLRTLGNAHVARRLLANCVPLELLAGHFLQLGPLFLVEHAKDFFEHFFAKLLVELLIFLLHL